MRLVLAALLLALSTGGAAAQSARWIDYDQIPFGSGASMRAVGASVIAFGYETTERLVFFDATRGLWHEHPFAAPHALDEIQAAGPLALAVLDDRAVAFLAGRGSFSVDLEGPVLSNFSGQAQVCAEGLAAVATDRALHVFDPILHAWHSRPFTLPADYNGGFRLVVGDVWAGLELRRDSPAPPMVVAYSTVLHAGAETVSGCALPPTEAERLDGGFAGLGGSGESLVATAWSAYTNAFDVIHAPWPRLTQWQMAVDGTHRQTRRAAVVGWLSGEPASRHYTALGFSTIRGCWNELRHDYVFGDWSGGDVFVDGGCFGWTICSAQGDDYALLFDGDNNRWEAYEPLVGDYEVSHLLSGGRDLVLLTDDDLMGRCVPTACEALAGRPATISGQAHAGEHFAAAGWYESTGQDSMEVRIYRGPSNQWWGGTFGLLTGSPNFVGTHLYVLRHGGGFLLYSDLSDTVHRLDLDPGSSWMVSALESTALLRSSVGSYHFDGARGVVHDLVGPSDGLRLLSDGVAVVSDSGSSIFRHWSARDGQWESTDLGQVPLTGSAKGNVALLAATYYARFWAFDGGSSMWAPLQPEGSSAGWIVGEDTAFVQRSSVLYGLAPGAGVPTAAAPTPPAPRRLLSLRAHPNPFNPVLRLDYRLSSAGRVRIDVLDARGRRVASLLDADQGAGDHSLDWKPSGVAAGVYLCRVRAGGETLTKKVSLVP